MVFSYWFRVVMLLGAIFLVGMSFLTPMTPDQEHALKTLILFHSMLVAAKWASTAYRNHTKQDDGFHIMVSVCNLIFAGVMFAAWHTDKSALLFCYLICYTIYGLAHWFHDQTKD